MNLVCSVRRVLHTFAVLALLVCVASGQSDLGSISGFVRDPSGATIPNAKVMVRNLRRDVMEELKGLEKDKEITQDEHKRILSQLQKVTDAFIAETEKVGKDKEAELRQV